MALDRVSSDRIREIRQERKKHSRIRFLIASISIIAIIVSIILISRSSQLQISSIAVRGNYIVSTEEVRSTVEEILNKYYLYFFPKRNVFIYPNHSIKYQVTTNFPRFEKVSIDRVNWNTLIVDVTERKNLYLYCDALLTDLIEPNCYYVDAKGYIFSQAPTFSGNIYFVFLGNYGWADGESPIGKHIAPENIFSEIIRFKEGIQQRRLTSYGFRSYTDDTYAFLLSPSFEDDNQKIIFGTTDDIETVYSNLISALESDALSNELTDHFDKLQYINLQYGKKVYYKFSQ